MAKIGTVGLMVIQESIISRGILGGALITSPSIPLPQPTSPNNQTGGSKERVLVLATTTMYIKGRGVHHLLLRTRQ